MSDIQQFSVSLKFKTEGAEKAGKDADEVGKKINKVKSSTAGMSKITSFFGTVGKGVGIATKAIAGMTVAGVTMATKMGKSMATLSKQTSDYIEKVNLFRTSMGSLAREAEDFVNMGEAKLGLDPAAMMDAISSFQNLSEGFGIASDRAYIMSKNLTQLSGDLSSFANISFEAAQKKLMSGFSGQVLPLRQYGIALDQASLQELAYSLGIEQRVKTMTRAQKTELIYYQIMKSTQKVQHDLGKTLMSPANALRVLQNEFKALARAVGSIFIPIIQKIIPIMRAVTKALTSAAKAIAQFFGFNVEDYTVDFAEVGDSIGGIEDDIDGVGGAAEKTAKKMQKMLMPFDELNNINSPNTSSSGSGGGYGAGSGGSLGIELPEYDMFEIINDKVMKFGDVLGKAREGAHKLNEALASIDWDRIKEGARIAGESVAKFFNVGIEETDWKLIGKTLAEGLNTAIESVYGFISTLNWGGLGDAISKSLNGFIDNIDWKLWADGISKFIKGTLATIYTVLENTEWDNLAKQLEVFVSNIDWNGVADSIFRGIGAAMGAIGEFFGQLLYDGIVASINFFTPKIEEQGGNVALGILYGIRDIFVNIGEWCYEHILKPFITGFNNVFEIHSPSKIMEKQGQYIMEGLLNGIASFVSKIGETWNTIKETITGKMEEIKTKAQEIFDKLWLGILKGSQFAVNKCIEGFNKIIDGINELGQYFGMHLDEIQPVKWADEFEQKMNEVSKTTDETGKDVVNSMGKTMEEMEKSSEDPLNTLGTNFSTTFTKIKENTLGNLGQAEIITKTKTDYIKSLITGNYSEAKKNVDISMEQIKTNTENNLSKISQSTFFGRIKSSFQTAFDNAKTAETLGSSAGTKYQEGFKNSFTNQNLNDIRWKIQNIFNLGNNAYTWGKDMIDGFMRGIDAARNSLTNTVSRVASSIRSFLHFSRPDEGPLRDYETWFPDMIKGLSDSMLKASPILEDAVSQVSNMVADSLSNIVMPEINQEVYANSYNSEAIRNIGNRTSNITKDETTGNMIRATYEAVSRALSDNKGTEDNRQIVVNVGNKELYRGYGQYKDEESNMLGIRI